MKASGTLSGFNNSIVDMNVYIDNPYSGFELTAMETGNGTRYNIFTFSGSQGQVYDQSGRFFAGYRSGTSLDLKVHYNYTEQLFSYYYNDNLVSNNMVPLNVNKSIDSIEFDKHNNSRLEASISGVLS
jgi:hypothetical protein